MPDAHKSAINKYKAPYLNEEWCIGANQARYREDGRWYARLSRFPAALIDAHGYVKFATEYEYLNSPYLQIGKQITVPLGISQMPNYVPVDESDYTADLDVRGLLAQKGWRASQSRKQRPTAFIVGSADLL